MKKIIVDSSSLITMSTTCLLSLFRRISEKENVKFIIPESVYYETVEKPIRIRRFELNALRIRKAVEEGHLEVAKTTPATKKTMEMLSTVTANICSANGRMLKLINLGEAETLALMKEISAEILLIDERTTRMIIEEPENVMSFLEKRHKCEIKVNRGELDKFTEFFEHIKIIRSVELIALAYKDGSFAEIMDKNTQSLEAALFAAKYAGCAVSTMEIKDFVAGAKA